MDDPSGTHHALAAAVRSTWGRRRIILIAALGLAVLLIGFAAWIGIRGILAKNELEAALPLVSQIKDQVVGAGFDTAQATIGGLRPTIDEVVGHTGAARDLTSDALWRAAEGIPFVGENLSAVRQLAQIADDIVTHALVPLPGMSDLLDPASLKPVNGTVDIQPFLEAEPVLREIGTTLAAASASIAAIDDEQLIGPVAAAKQKLSALIRSASPLVVKASLALEAIPGLLGFDGARSYLVVFMNNAEARALGGHAGSWALVTADHGTISLVAQVGVGGLTKTAVPVVDVPGDILSLWGPGTATDPGNVGIDPRLDLSANTAKAFWQQRYGGTIDAVLFFDPVALGYLLAATGPVTAATGDVISTENAADFLLNGVYLSYPVGGEQDPVFQSAAAQTFALISTGAFDPKKLLDAAIEAGKQRRLLLWSFHAEERELLAATPFNGRMPGMDDANATFGVYVQDNLGSKMTYYVDASVALGQAQCSTGTTQYRVDFTATNAVVPGTGESLPTYVANTTNGSLRIFVTLYAPPGTSIVSAIGSSDYPPLKGTDGEYSAMQVRMVLDPGQTATVSFDVVAPDDRPRTLDALVTPLAKPTEITRLEGYTC
ncbi:MAG: hypothetical protein JWP85_2347 [Rhodoglobus sp.]|nr:hypothetical protein [Rhodoglobus sp.]